MQLKHYWPWISRVEMFKLRPRYTHNIKFSLCSVSNDFSPRMSRRTVEKFCLIRQVRQHKEQARGEGYYT